LVVGGIAIELQPTEPIFEKCSHVWGRGGADAFENDPPFRSKGSSNNRTYLATAVLSEF
jgi:hypothetical protein